MFFSSDSADFVSCQLSRNDWTGVQVETMTWMTNR